VGELDDFGEQVKLMFDLLALAFQADLTRVVSYIMAAEGTALITTSAFRMHSIRPPTMRMTWEESTNW
jgi:hypothetical protein